MAPADAVDAVMFLLDELEALLVDLRRVAETMREEDPGAGTNPAVDPGS